MKKFRRLLAALVVLIVAAFTGMRFSPASPPMPSDTNGDGKPDYLQDCRIEEFPWATKLSTTCRYRKDEDFDGFYDISYLQGCFGAPYEVARIHESVH